MLRNLHIKNLALIKEVDVDFSGGLNILTGETGSGKSIIVDSIGLALGGRAQRDLTRSVKGTALVELVFEVNDEETLAGLSGTGTEAEDGVLIISRKFQDGRSQIRVNGETRTAAEVREIAALLLDIHGQSEHQKLLRSDRQLELLDIYGQAEIEPAKKRTADAYRTWSALKNELGGEPMSPQERERRKSFLEFEIREIEDARLVPGEDEEVERLYRKLANGRRIADAVGEAHEATGYSGDAAGDLIGGALKKLGHVCEYDERLEELAEQLGEIEGLLNDFNRELSEYADELDYEAGAFEETEERLNTINHLKSRYGNSIEEIGEELARRKEELAGLADYEEQRAKKERELSAAEEDLEEACGELTALRKAAAERFIRDASVQFADLNFARADFSIEFRKTDRPTSGGSDQIDFVISTNPGEERRPLRNVVSGGELSRLMLGIRTMFADRDSTDSIIFDEVDTGISGRTAQKAAEKMACVAKEHQVLCITHLPQIAAMADAHYGISKEVSDGGAITNIEQLSEDESVKELARLIGGAEITENTLKSAQEMKEMCRQFKELGI